MPLREDNKDEERERRLRAAEPVLPPQAGLAAQRELDLMTQEVGDFAIRKMNDQEKEALERHRNIEKSLLAIFPREAIAVARDTVLSRKLDLSSRDGRRTTSGNGVRGALDGSLSARPPTSSQGVVPRTPAAGRTTSTPAAVRLPAFMRPPTGNLEDVDGAVSPPMMPPPSSSFSRSGDRKTVSITPGFVHRQQHLHPTNQSPQHCSAANATQQAPGWLPNLLSLRRFSESQFVSLQRWAETSFNDALLFDEKQRETSARLGFSLGGGSASAKQYLDEHATPGKVLVSSTLFIIDELMSSLTGFDALWPRMREVLFRSVYVDKSAAPSSRQGDIPLMSALSSRGGTAGGGGGGGGLPSPRLGVDDDMGTGFHGEGDAPQVVYDSSKTPHAERGGGQGAVTADGGAHSRIGGLRGFGGGKSVSPRLAGATTSAAPTATGRGTQQQQHPPPPSAPTSPTKQVDFRRMLTGAPLVTDKCLDLFQRIDDLQLKIDSFDLIRQKLDKISILTAANAGRIIVNLMFKAWRGFVVNKGNRLAATEEFSITNNSTLMKSISFLRWRRYVVQLQRNRLRDASACATTAALQQADEVMSKVEVLEMKLVNAQRQHRVEMGREEEMRKTLMASHKIEMSELRAVQDQKDDIILSQEKNCRRWERIAKYHRPGGRSAPPKGLITIAKKLREVEEELLMSGHTKARLNNARILMEKFLLTWVNAELDQSKSRIRNITNVGTDLRDGDVFIALARALRKTQPGLVKTAGDLDPFASLMTLIYVHSAQGLFPPLLLHCGFYTRFFTADHMGSISHPLGNMWILATLFVARALQTGSTHYWSAEELKQPNAHTTPPLYLTLMDGPRFLQEQREAIQAAKDANKEQGTSRPNAAASRPSIQTMSTTLKTAIGVGATIKSAFGGGRPVQATPSLDAPEDDGEWSNDSSDNDAYFGRIGSDASSDDEQDGDPIEMEATLVSTECTEKVQAKKPPPKLPPVVQARKLPPCPKELVSYGVKDLVLMLAGEEVVNEQWCGLARVVTSLILRYRILDMEQRSSPAAGAQAPEQHRSSLLDATTRRSSLQPPLAEGGGGHSRAPSLNAVAASVVASVAASLAGASMESSSAAPPQANAIFPGESPTPVDSQATPLAAFPAEGAPRRASTVKFT